MYRNPYLGKFVCFEGIDASGKSEQYFRIRNFFNAYKDPTEEGFVFTKEPNIAHESGVEIYDILLGKHPTLKFSTMHPFEMQSRYFRNRIWQYKNVVIPALSNATPVISDRGVASMCFGVDSFDDFGPLMAIQEQAFLGAEVPFIWPDLILIFDVPAEVAKERLLARGKDLDGFERDFNLQMRVRQNYVNFAEKYPYCEVIDASGKPEDIFVKTRDAVTRALGMSK